ncbi:MAG: GAF domain-containing protein [Anaerolineae bacterium]|nr:GAF domain-containing protein [Anaerolineae bacterium]
MKQITRYVIAITLGFITTAILIGLTVTALPSFSNLLIGILFGALIVFTLAFGVPLSEGSVSLMPMTAIAAYLVVGLIPAGWAALFGAVLHGLVRYGWGHRLGEPNMRGIRLIALTAANATMHTLSILAGGTILEVLGGDTPLDIFGLRQLFPFVSLALAYLGTNYVIAGFHIALRGKAPFQSYLRFLPGLVWYEGAPIIFAPLMALIYNQLGWIQFALFALALIVATLISRSLAFTSRRLGQRVKELDSLQAVGQALSASLQVETVVAAIHEQVVQLMPAQNFYIALYDTERNEVSFPLCFEQGERVQWHSRRAGNGLTEYVLHTRQPLLIEKDVEAKVCNLGIDHIGTPAVCWLGVPLLSGEETLGVIAVQSFSETERYTSANADVLTTIAAQAAVAIQNAHLYARTDEALARRVQELDSILRTTGEGVLLLDPEWCVLAANRAISELLGVAQLELAGQPLGGDDCADDAAGLVAKIGYTAQALRDDCGTLCDGSLEQKQAIVLVGNPERYIERTLTPVKDRQNRVSGWLLIFRDISEEVELARLREDTTHMLVHDLRSPLTVVMGTLDLMKYTFGKEDEDKFDKLLSMCKGSSVRMLDMVNQLLDIGKLESGQLPIHPQNIVARDLLSDVAARLAPLAAEARITLEINADPDLPNLFIDPDLIGRVLNNLLDNAIKFTPDEGRVELWARRQLDVDGLLLGVSDSGPGIPPEALPRLFEKFQQVDSVQGRRKGTGLGLPFCKLAVEAHGGEIWVESKVGKGTTFLMTLPAQNGTADIRGLTP